MESVTYNLKRLRNVLRLTQGQLAEAIDVKRTTVASWETGISQPGPVMLRKIAEKLKVSIDEFTKPIPDDNAANVINNTDDTTKSPSDLIEYFKKEAEFKNLIIQQLLTKLNEK